MKISPYSALAFAALGSETLIPTNLTDTHSLANDHQPLSPALHTGILNGTTPRGTSSVIADMPPFNKRSQPTRLSKWMTLQSPADEKSVCRQLAENIDAGLNATDLTLLDQAVADSRLIHKTQVQNIRRLLETFPRMHDGIHGKSICASTVLDTPLVTTFNGKDSRFFGVILNPERMVPIIAGTIDLKSDCRYDPGKWSAPTTENASSRQLWSARPVVNALSPDELCHDMGLTMRALNKDAIFPGGTHDFIEPGKILAQNEIVLVSNDHDKPLAQGIFVDLISNAMLMFLARPEFRPLLWLGKPVSNERWMQAIQAVNIRLLKKKPEEFLEAKKLCQELDLPFLVRSLGKDGTVAFQPIALGKAQSLDELPDVRALLDAHADPLIDPLVDKLSRVFAL